MKHPRGTRTRLGGVLLALTAALAMLALPGLASSHKPDHDPPGDAGVIQSYDSTTGLLTVDLAEGDTISALVVERTKIRCGKPPRRGHGDGPFARPGSDDGVRPPKGDGPRDEDNSGPGGGDESRDDPPGHDGTPPGASEDPGQGAEHRARRCDEDDLVPAPWSKKRRSS